MEVAKKLLKPERRKSEEISALSLTIFVGMSVLDLLLSNLNLKFLLKFVPYLHAKWKKREHCFLG